MGWSAARSRNFGSLAELYERVRPGYPADGVEWLLPDSALDVLDCGVGTGKLSDAVLATGRRVTAADPDDGMLAVLRAKHPGIPTFVATAEELPFPSASFDAIVFGQSWHWVDPERAGVEIARVLRPGGVLGMLWNLRDAREPWVEELAAITGHRSADERYLGEGGPRVGGGFVPDGSAEFEWTAALDVPTLVDLIATHGFAMEDAPGERAHLLDDVLALGRRVADEHGIVRLPYVLRVFRFRRG